MEVSNVALLAANDVATAASVLPLKLVMNGPAYPLVTCRHIPKRAEKIKNRAICFRLNSLKAFKPRLSANDFFYTFFCTLHSGNDRQ